jgi:hypothetical protein
MVSKRNKRKKARRVADRVEARVRWLLSLSSRPENDRLYRLEMAEYVFPALDTVANTSRMDSDTLREWFLELREVVQRLSSEPEWKSNFRLHYTVSVVRGALTVKTAVIPADEIACWVYKTLMSLRRPLIRCRRQGCSTLIVRHRRQRYCSSKCSSYARVKRFREARASLKKTAHCPA